MLFPADLWPRITDGRVTVAFRRWKRPSVKASGTLQSPAGLLAIDEVTPIEESDISDAEARAAGYSDAREVVAGLRPEGTLYRVRFRRIGEDPRIALRKRTAFDDGELARLRASVDRLPWADATLRLIASQPNVVSTHLAATMGVDRASFKQRVRRLKSLGLTESLDVGYRLSPRGEALLDLLDRRGADQG